MFDMDPAYLFLSFIFSLIGLAYFIYGKRKNLYFSLAGVALMIFPYFVTQVGAMLLWGVLLLVLPIILNSVMPFDD